MDDFNFNSELFSNLLGDDLLDSLQFEQPMNTFDSMEPLDPHTKLFERTAGVFEAPDPNSVYVYFMKRSGKKNSNFVRASMRASVCADKVKLRVDSRTRGYGKTLCIGIERGVNVIVNNVEYALTDGRSRLCKAPEHENNPMGLQLSLPPDQPVLLIPPLQDKRADAEYEYQQLSIRVSVIFNSNHYSIKTKNEELDVSYAGHKWESDAKVVAWQEKNVSHLRYTFPPM